MAEEKKTKDTKHQEKKQEKVERKEEENEGNLTQLLGIVKQIPQPAPQAGYDVVVYRKKRGAIIPEGVVNFGSKPLTGFFKPSSSYISYAVRSAPNLKIEFNTKITLKKRHQEFFLKCIVYFQVTSPEKVTLSFQDDPINRIRGEIRIKFKRFMINSEYDIEDVIKKFADIEEDIREHTMGEIRNYALEYGVHVEKIEMLADIPGIFTEVEKKIDIHEKGKAADYVDDEKDDLGKNRDLKNLEHNLTKENMEHFNKIKKDLSERFMSAVDKVVDDIGNREDLGPSIDSVISGVKKIQRAITERTGNSPEPAIASRMAELKAISSKIAVPGIFDEARDLLTEILAKINDITMSSHEGEEEEIKRNVLSKATHLLAELDLEKNADPQVIKTYLEPLGEQIKKHRSLIPHELFENMESLNRELKNYLVTD